MERHPEVEALETRCQIVKFEPTVESLHARAKALPGVERAVLRYVDAAIREGRVHRINYRDYIVASQLLRIGEEWEASLEQKFLPDDLEALDSDEDVILGWARSFDRDSFSTRDLLAGPRRFRNQKEMVEGLLARMVAEGSLDETKPVRRAGQKGRPQGSRYSVPKNRAAKAAGKSLALAG